MCDIPILSIFVSKIKNIYCQKNMKTLRIVGPLARFFLASSAHALTDATTVRRTLPYILLLFPTHETGTKYAFFLASIVHFGCDVGFCASALFILILFLLSEKHELASSSCLCIYYLVVHVPLHMMQQSQTTITFLTVVSLCALCCLHSTVSFTVTSSMQKLVIAHTLSSFL